MLEKEGTTVVFRMTTRPGTQCSEQKAGEGVLSGPLLTNYIHLIQRRIHRTAPPSGTQSVS